MPHCILEYTDNILDDADFPYMFQRLHQLLVESGCCELRNLKSRAYPVEHFRMADGDELNAFAHLTIRVLEGKTPERLQSMGEAALALMEEFFKLSLEEQRCDLTVEIVEMKRSHYFKLKSLK